MAKALDPAAVRSWCAAAVGGLTAARGEIDRLNVYPVPDRDTGTNLLLTMRSAGAAVEAAADGAPGATALLGAVAAGALQGARGNSGVILSQLLLGVSQVLGEQPVCDAGELAAALRHGCRLAYLAVDAPVEGTILSVLAAAADAAEGAVGQGLRAVAVAAAAAAATATRRTTEQLPALAAAGVVDAGGRGLCVLLDALAAVVTGTAQPLPSASPLSPVQPSPAGSAGPPGQHGPGYAYEVEYLLDAPAVAVDRLRVALAGLGGSLVVVGSAPGWKVHVHTDDVGAAIEAGIAAGRPSQVRVTRFADHQDAPATAGVRAVVAVAHGDGIRHLLEDGGAVVVAAVPGCGPSASELLAAVRASGAAEVVLLPNDQGGHAVARLIADQARSEGVAVAVVPTRSAVQGLAALAVADPARRFDEDVITMTSAAGATRCAELTVAEHGAITTAGLCRAGDVLGIVDGEVVLIGSELEAAALDLVERMLAAGGELVTVVLGSSAPPGLGSVLDRHLHQARPGVETVVYLGGQQEPPVLLGVE